MAEAVHILIVEDEMIIAANLSLQLTEMGYEVAGIIPRPEEALANIRQRQPDIVLLDINLKSDMDGIDLAHEMQKEFDIAIVYLTANSDEPNFERAKRTNPYAFLSKPYKKLDLQRTIELVANQISRHKSVPVPIVNHQETLVLSDCIFIRHHDKMIRLDIKEILYIEAERNYCRIHSKEKKHLLVMTLKDLDEKLPSRHFIRIHRSFIVNISQIDEVALTHVVIARKAIPVSKPLKDELLKRLQTI
ncbi:LytTR family transcriptional regulator DNA-binding domain-containing protein [Flavobacterium sp.]|uniref:LytR/AlgR family response regulator transcription factor n=1 Tax=Flavobacterium sp. TaxID=239 RepID=UPI0011FB3751|nr:LytTR family transcriptional regulator DNA-binding domain-containing protein [Flavobacterium sp.]RZJ69103.1 MAG: response regulator transcription factor [Flavobacterium sp.]